MEKYSAQICVQLLREKQEQLRADGSARYPQRSDFSDEEVIAIKSFLGPWPRALEKAGLKPINQERIEKKKRKRIASRVKKRQYKIEAQKARAQKAEEKP